METEQTNWTVISLGGSLIVPGEIDTGFLKSFKDLIESRVARGESFVLITGGGRTARNYQDALSAVATVTSTDLDWIGIGALRLNATLVRSMFGELAHSEVINTGVDGFVNIKKSVVVCGADAPGSSTDLGSVKFAKHVGAKRLVNLSNIDQVYTADPRTNPDATPIDTISWKDYRVMIPSEWKPGLSAPFDPVASKMAEEMGLEVAVMNGKNLSNPEQYLAGGAFTGTVIS